MQRVHTHRNGPPTLPSAVRTLKVGDLTLTEARAIYKELSEIFA